jgi:uncharacterized protein YbjT (DUF2867 family)
MTGQGYSAIVLGATGNVGGRIVELLVESPRCQRVVVVVRRHTAAFANPKITELVVEMDRLEEGVAPHARGVDVALAAFGVGKGSAKMSDDELRKIEVEYPRAFCRAAKAGGARVCALMSAGGANPDSSIRYVRLLGEKEQAAKELGFDFLGLFRPGVILGNSNTPSLLNGMMPLVDWAMPSKFHSIHKNDLARAMVAQSELALDDHAQGQPTVKVLEFDAMKPFFVQGDRARR